MNRHFGKTLITEKAKTEYPVSQHYSWKTVFMCVHTVYTAFSMVYVFSSHDVGLRGRERAVFNVPVCVGDHRQRQVTPEACGGTKGTKL